MDTEKQYTRTLKDYAILGLSFVPAAILTWSVHELGHYFSGMALGYDMWVSLNRAGPVQGGYDSDLHSFVVSMAGPVVTWAQGILAYLAVRWSKELWAYSFVFLTFWMRSLAMIISFIAKPNDEAKASLLMDMPIWAYPSISVALLLGLTVLANRELRAGWKENVVAIVASSMVTAGIVFADEALF